LLGLRTPSPDDEDAISFQATLEKIREVSKAIRSSPQRWDIFKAACKSYDIEPVTIPLDVAPRWSSTHDMGQQYIYLSKPVDRFLDDCGLKHLKLTTSEFEMAELLVVFLMPFKRCTKRFECNADEPEIDYVFFAYDSLFNHIEDVKTALEGATALAALPSAPYMLDALCNMEEKFKIYYKKTELPTVYGDSTHAVSSPFLKRKHGQMRIPRNIPMVVVRDFLKAIITRIITTVQQLILHPHRPLHLINGQECLHSMVTTNFSKRSFSGQRKDFERTMIVILTLQTMSGLRLYHGGEHTIPPFLTLLPWPETTLLFQHLGVQWKGNSPSPEESSVGKEVA